MGISLKDRWMSARVLMLQREGFTWKLAVIEAQAQWDEQEAMA